MDVEEAKNELQLLGQWFEDFASRQNLHPQYLVRAGYLQGFLAGQPTVEPVPAEPEPEPKSEPKRRPAAGPRSK